MIEITDKECCITIKGHAGYAPHGQDIVCAAVSALTQVFLSSVGRLTADALKCDIAEGNAVIQYENLSSDAKLLKDSFFLGVRMIADEYPEHVKLTEA